MSGGRRPRQSKRSSALPAPAVSGHSGCHPPSSVFTLDAVIDDDDRVWLLEMNSHPMIHPNVYPHMLASVFTEETPAASA